VAFDALPPPPPAPHTSTVTPVTSAGQVHVPGAVNTAGVGAAVAVGVLVEVEVAVGVAVSVGVEVGVIVGVTAMPVHTPAKQTSLIVFGLPSLHAVPSGLGGFVQTPVAGLHVPTLWH
jgi:hypothetical protein